MTPIGALPGSPVALDTERPPLDRFGAVHVHVAVDGGAPAQARVVDPFGRRCVDTAQLGDSADLRLRLNLDRQMDVVSVPLMWTEAVGSGDSCASSGTPLSARHTTMAALAAHILRMGSPLSCAGRVRQWLGAVPATRVWAAPQRLPLTTYDGRWVVEGSRIGGRAGVVSTESDKWRVSDDRYPARMTNEPPATRRWMP